jgi:3-hydroxyisobutyryl-CoA hydrolase
LTGNRIKGISNKKLGIATHFVGTNNISNLEKELCDTNNLSTKLVDDIINKYDLHLESNEYDLKKIYEMFNAPTLEEIYMNLEKDNTDWSKQQIKLLNKMNPTSLKVSIRQLNKGLNMDLKSCLQLEYQLCQRFGESKDFYEGVRAVLIDKGSKPNWSPASYKEVTNEQIDWFFKPLPTDEKLILV